MTTTTETDHASITSQQSAVRIEQRINDTLHRAISRSLERHPGRDPRIESFSPSPQHVGGHAQRLTTVSSRGRILEVMVAASSSNGQWQAEVSIFHRSANDPVDTPPIDIIEESEAHLAADIGCTLAKHVEAYFTGLDQPETTRRHTSDWFSQGLVDERPHFTREGDVATTCW